MLLTDLRIAIAGTIALAMLGVGAMDKGADWVAALLIATAPAVLAIATSATGAWSARASWGGPILAASGDELAQGREVDVRGAAEAHAALADVRLRQPVGIAAREVLALDGAEDVQRDVVLVRGEAQQERVALAAAGVAVVERAVPDRAVVGRAFELWRGLADQVVKQLDLGPTGSSSSAMYCSGVR